MQALFAFIFIAIVVAVFWHSAINTNATLDVWYQEALQEFNSLNISATPEIYSFNGETSEIVKTERIGGRTRNGIDRSTFTVVIFAKNKAGEYFMFRKTSTDKPFFKHVDQRMAINVLHLEKLQRQAK